ncbi:hypothetical protein ANO14919_055540 [Xylariales sp. No.14919]|nr:hypothetical protein ANO14919_055540 [Xylariales sp. No.14919]
MSTATEAAASPIPATHKACVYDQPGTCSIAIRDVPTPEPGANEVLVKLTHSGICHSDHGIMENASLPDAAGPGGRPRGPRAHREARRRQREGRCQGRGPRRHQMGLVRGKPSHSPGVVFPRFFRDVLAMFSTGLFPNPVQTEPLEAS